MARTDRAYLKKFEDETNLRAHLLLDRSKSMTYGSGSYTKADYSATLAATFAYFLMGQQDAVGLTTFDRGIDSHLPARNRTGQLRQILLQLEKAPAGESTDLGAAMKGLHELIRKRSLVVLLSDLLAPIGDLEKQIGILRPDATRSPSSSSSIPANSTSIFPRPPTSATRKASATSSSIRRGEGRIPRAPQRASRGDPKTLFTSWGELPARADERPLEQVLFEFVNLRRG